MLMQYIRSKTNRKVGVMLAIPSDSDPTKVTVAWSKCCDLDRFDRERGKKIALERAKANKCAAIIPPEIEEDLTYFAGRVGQYYKDKTIEVLGDKLEKPIFIKGDEDYFDAMTNMLSKFLEPSLN